MPRFYFDIYGEQSEQIDEEGHEFGSLEDVQREAQRLLPNLLHHESARDADRRFYMVLVRDERGQPVYSATLTYAGTFLSPHPEQTWASFAPGSQTTQ